MGPGLSGNGRNYRAVAPTLKYGAFFDWAYDVAETWADRIDEELCAAQLPDARRCIDTHICIGGAHTRTHAHTNTHTHARTHTHLHAYIYTHGPRAYVYAYAYL